ncbi:alpha-N-acetylglucosaminidase [Streptomyces boninensis]|uniref:alpha-N-acetylglucosaminidase n=1 Tax=Streptomyces boninensis TaxID=2039455 RepID=UPI003B223766
MTEVSRRTLLGSASVLGAGLAVSGGAWAARGGVSRRPAPDPAPAAAAARRLLPAHADQLTFVPLAENSDRFTVRGSRGAVEIAGTTPAVMLTGLHWYLKYACDAHISWSGSQLDLPRTLPAPRSPLERTATVPVRFALNDTHDGYTGPYDSWAQWERTLDILALHGCNQIFVTPGQEAVYHRLLKEFGYSDNESRSWIPAPSHQPWWLLQNLSGYGGPVSPGALARRVELGQRIVRRLRELGMAPVLPGYFGSVPTDFAGRNKGAATIPQGTWNNLRRPDWLDPRTPLFREVAAAYYRHQAELFGPADHFKMDLLHEGGRPGDVPVPDAARAVEQALRSARPGATWVIIGWQNNPTPELLSGVDTDRMLIVDGLSDLDGTTDREETWGGTPYAFGTIPNFGGRTTIGAKTHRWTERFTAWRDKEGSALVGTAYMPEATHRDPAAFELFSELAWREEAVDRAEWFTAYARYRYGGQDAGAADAFAVLRETAYELNTTDGRPYESIFTARPSLTAGANTYDGAFDQPDFDAVLTGLLTMPPWLRDSDAYRHDLTDVTRQCLANRSRLLLPQLRAAYERGDLRNFRRLATLWLRLIQLSDEITGAHASFLLGPWLRQAARAGTSRTEAADFERTARVLLTTWAGRAAAEELADYADRDWHGLLSGLHLPRWRRFLDEHEAALAAEREPSPIDWYELEAAWTRDRTAHPVRPVADAYKVATRIRDVLAAAPFQGRIRVTTAPEPLPPGAKGELRATFRNENGLASTGQVDMQLTGLKGVPEQVRRVADTVDPAGSTSATWTLKAPSGAPDRPLLPLPYQLRTGYGANAGDRMSHPVRGAVYVGRPVRSAGLRTYSGGGDAVFGEAEDGRLGIAGAGRDFWKGNEEFGAIYREAALGPGGTATVRVDSQERTAHWARAGLLIRNDITHAAGKGLVTLSVTPSRGVVLSYDSDGNGSANKSVRVPGISAPVTLRLRRDGDTYTGELSTDDSRGWRRVGRVRVPGSARRQDAGVFMTAASGGTGVRGLVEFAEWRV